MREIKFRAFYNGKMYRVENWMFKVGMSWVIVEDESVEKIPAESIMQYTGLKDANDKEIYEGDVVEYLYWGTKTCTEVKWQDDTSGFYPFADSPENCGHCGLGRNPNECIVIGNIYENPELLERIIK